MAAKSALGQSALYQLITRAGGGRLSETEIKEKMQKVEATAKKYDKKGKGRLTVDELYEVLKKKNEVECTKTDIRKVQTVY